MRAEKETDGAIISRKDGENTVPVRFCVGWRDGWGAEGWGSEGAWKAGRVVMDRNEETKERMIEEGIMGDK